MKSVLPYHTYGHWTLPPPRLLVFWKTQLLSLQELAGDILMIVRLRLKRVLDYLETSPAASGSLLASLDADTCQWVRSARELDTVGIPGSEGSSGSMTKGPLRSTHGVLLCLMRALPRDSRHKVN